MMVRNRQQRLCFHDLSVQVNGSFRCWFMLFPEVAETMETGKSNNMHESPPTRTTLMDHQNLPLAARMEVVPGKEDWGSPRSPAQPVYSQLFPPAWGWSLPNCSELPDHLYSPSVCWKFSRGSSYLKKPEGLEMNHREGMYRDPLGCSLNPAALLTSSDSSTLRACLWKVRVANTHTHSCTFGI